MLETILPVLQPGESAEHKIRVLFTSRGRVRFVVQGEVVGGGKSGERYWGGEGMLCEVS